MSGSWPPLGRAWACSPPDDDVADLQPLVGVTAALKAIPSAALLKLEILAFPLAAWLPELERILDELSVPRWAARHVRGDTIVVAEMAEAAGRLLRDLAPDLERHGGAVDRQCAQIGGEQATADAALARTERSSARALSRCSSMIARSTSGS